MKAVLLIDSEGENPEYYPIPDPRVDKLAFLKHTRDVPHTIIVPAGTVLDGPMCWVHCLPDAAGVVRAVPADEECELQLEHNVKTLHPKARALLERFRKRIPELKLAIAHRQKDAAAKPAAAPA